MPPKPTASAEVLTPRPNALQREFRAVPELLVCAHTRCQMQFEPKRKGQKFCSDRCRHESWKNGREGTATVNEEPQKVLGIVLVMNASSDGDKTNLPCGFCHRLNQVDLKKSGRQNAVCRCGARYFRRYGRRVLGDGSGRAGYQEESGWKKGKREAFFL